MSGSTSLQDKYIAFLHSKMDSIFRNMDTIDNILAKIVKRLEEEEDLVQGQSKTEILKLIVSLMDKHNNSMELATKVISSFPVPLKEDEINLIVLYSSLTGPNKDIALNMLNELSSKSLKDTIKG